MRYRTYALPLLTVAVIRAQMPPAPPPDLLKETANRPRLSLADFENFALASNPTLTQAGTLPRESASRGIQAGLLPNPTVGYQGEHIRGGSYGGGEQGGFIQQDIVLGGKLGLRRNVYEQQRRTGEIGAVEQRARVSSGVAQSFYSALAAQETVVVRRRLLYLARDAVQTARQLANIGQADEPDILQAEVEAEQALVDYTAAQHRYVAQFRALASGCGKPELALSALEGKLESTPAIDPDHVVENMLSESPSVKRAQQDVLRAEAEWKAAKRESVPDLQLRGGLDQANEQLTPGQPTKLVGVEGFATVGIALPIFNRNQGSIAAAQLGLERARAEVTRVQLSLRQTASQLREEYLARLAEANVYRDEMIPTATRAYQLYLGKYRNMAAAYPQVIVSQRTLFQLQVSYVNALENLWKTSVSLQNYTLSGSLDPPASNGVSQ